MSIANELSSDVAAAVLKSKVNDTSISPSELAGVVIAVHSTLRKMTAEARKRRGRAPLSNELPPTGKSVASGNQ